MANLPTNGLNASATPLVPILTFSFVASLGTAVVSEGIFFLARHTYDFDARRNFLLGAIFAVVYIPSALCIGPMLQVLRARLGISSRAALIASSIILGLACLLPITAHALNSPGAWSIWVLMAVYSPASGALWPLVEAFLSGGRSGASLRSSTGKFNVTWSSALVVAFWAIAPFVETHALAILSVLGCLHIVSSLLLILVPKEPDPHPSVQGHSTTLPANYPALLSVFRVQLPCAFVGVSALSAYLPGALHQLGIASGWQTPIAATWMLSRVPMFLIMERWHAWHGRWQTPLWAGGCVASGFALSILAPLAPAGIGAVVMIAGLAVFGIGVGIVYAAALYYALEVGTAEVGAGGKHEALIGVGYLGGPACGLLALSLISPTGAAPPEEAPVFQAIFAALVTFIASGTTLLAMVLAARQLRQERATRNQASS